MIVSRVKPSADAWPRTILKPWQKDMWCIPKVDAEYVARMEDVLDLYAEQLDPKRPRRSASTKAPTQLIGEARQPIPAAPGRLSERFDYEYRRNGNRQSLRLRRCPSLLAQGQGH